MRILNIERAVEPRVCGARGAVQAVRPAVRVLKVPSSARDERIEVGRAGVARRWLDDGILFGGTLDRLAGKNCAGGEVCSSERRRGNSGKGIAYSVIPILR